MHSCTPDVVETSKVTAGRPRLAPRRRRSAYRCPSLAAISKMVLARLGYGPSPLRAQGASWSRARPRAPWPAAARRTQASRLNIRLPPPRGHEPFGVQIYIYIRQPPLGASGC